MKYIIEFEDAPFLNDSGEELYRAKGFKSLVFDAYGLSRLTPYEADTEGRNAGIKEAWNLAAEIVRMDPWSGDPLSAKSIRPGLTNYQAVKNEYDKYMLRCRRKLFRVCDEILVKECRNLKGVIMSIEDEHTAMVLYSENGEIHSGLWDLDHMERTGRNISYHGPEDLPSNG